MRVVRVLGHSDAGKTTLIERLVAVLSEYSHVATIKSIHHDIEFDEEGTDTYRHRVAGSERVIGITPSQTFSIETRGKDHHAREQDALPEVLDDLSAQNYAYVLIEGFSSSSLPAIVVGDRDSGNEVNPLARVDDLATVDIERLVASIDQLDPWTRSQ